jgi:hypothetical protein
MDVGHQPRCVHRVGCGLAQKIGRILHHPRRHKNRQRDNGAPGLPALHRLCAGVEGIDLDPVFDVGDAQYHLAGMQALLQRRGQTPGQPGVALGPGEQAFAFSRLQPRGVKAVAAGEVMQAGPGRHRGNAGAVIVAAAVVQVPAQVRIGEAIGLQIRYKSDSFLRTLHGG